MRVSCVNMICFLWFLPPSLPLPTYSLPPFLTRIPSSKLPYDVSNDQALEHEEVRMRIGRTIQVIRALSDRFQQSILDSVDKIP